MKSSKWAGTAAVATIWLAMTGSALAKIPGAPAGIVPEGLWVLNPARSQSLNPGRQTLWVIKDDGKHLVWVSVAIDDRHRAQVMSYDGAYGGGPAPVVGTPMTSSIFASGVRKLHNFGSVAGMGDYSEDCAVSADRKRFRCEGQVQTPAGPRRYVDDFDFYAKSPPSARP